LACQLTEQHRHQLSPTAETPRVPFSLVLSYRGCEPIPWNQLENLAENAAYSFQGEASSIDWIGSCRN
jgi:hypothetical protein